jgi:hypothetical protein
MSAETLRIGYETPPRPRGEPPLMTDPVLAALLADPAPDARAIAADYAHDRGEELLEAWLRLIHRGGIGVDLRLRLNPRHGPRSMGIPIDHQRGGGFRVRLLAPTPLGIALLCWPDGRYWESEEFSYLAGKGWHQRQPKSGRRPSRFRLWKPAIPPPGLEAAVLAVLRRRLAEICTT